MSVDISRHLFDPRMRYATALMQQGRVLNDSCWNEMVRLEADDRRQIIAETVCTGGSPNDGFRIGFAPLPAPQVPPPPTPTVMVPLFMENPPAGATPVPSYDLTLGAGSFYLGGYRFAIDPTV